METKSKRNTVMFLLPALIAGIAGLVWFYLYGYAPPLLALATIAVGGGALSLKAHFEPDKAN